MSSGPSSSGGLTFRSRRPKQQKITLPEMPENGPESLTPSGSDGAAHLELIRAPALDDEASHGPDHVLEVDEDGNLPAPPPEHIDKSAFYEVFKIAFSTPGMIFREFRPLAIQDEEREQARAASDAIHSLLEIYYPSALAPNSETLAHVMAAGPFLIGKALVVREIMRGSRARPVNAQNQPEAPAPEAEQAPPSSSIGDWYLPGQEVPA